MLEERNERGQLVWAETSNHQAAMRRAFPGYRRARPRADREQGVTPPAALPGDWPRIEGAYTVPGGRSR